MVKPRAFASACAIGPRRLVGAYIPRRLTQSARIRHGFAIPPHSFQRADGGARESQAVVRCVHSRFAFVLRTSRPALSRLGAARPHMRGFADGRLLFAFTHPPGWFGCLPSRVKSADGDDAPDRRSARLRTAPGTRQTECAPHWPRRPQRRRIQEGQRRAL